MGAFYMDIISKKNILNMVSSHSIMMKYLQPYYNGINLKSGQRISNPILSDKQKTPSFNIYKCQNNDKWRYKDFATGDEGSEFDLVMALFHLDFRSALRKINSDFTLGLDDVNYTSNIPVPKPTAPADISSYSEPLPTKEHNDFTIEEGGDFSYWRKFGLGFYIDQTLKQYEVKSLKSYTAKTKEGKRFTINAQKNDPIFAFKISDECYKIYRPNATNGFKHLWLGAKPDGYRNIFGISQLPASSEVIIIVEGLKDTLTANANKFPAVGLDNAATKIDTDIIAELKSRCNHLLLCLDIDEPGIKSSERLSREHGLRRLVLPAKLKEKNGKDISDYFLNNIGNDDLRALISETIKSPLPESAEIANFAKSANPQTTEEENQAEDYLKNTPFIPDSVFNQLPEILKSGCSLFTDKRERDVFLTAAITILSGCMPNVEGIYNQQKVFPNLFVFIIAPPANGKGVLTYAEKLAEKYHAKIKKESDDKKEIYEMELLDYKNGEKKKGQKPPKKPKFKVLLIPANSSYSKVLWHLDQNDGFGIICETEADTMNNAMKQDWGGYSDMLRKAFHHERISSSKKTNDEYINILLTALSVLLSGTPNQVTGLIKSAEDGLFSRFIFYVYKVIQEWRDVSPKANEICLSDYFDKMSDHVMKIIEHLKEYPTKITLSDNQWNTLNATCKGWLKDVTVFSGDGAGSIVKRLGLILYRIAMVFTALRKFENGDCSKECECCDEDFSISVQLAQLYLEHSLFMFHNLPRQNEKRSFNNGSNKEHFFNELPKEFKREDAIELGKKYKLADRTVDALLKSLIGKYLERPAPGKYVKV
jgi:hypothetical protein